jgi:Fe2+ or Zn2+ uptake regulation protein
MLEQLGLLRKVYLQGKSDLFESALHHHHHIVCTSCGTIEDFELCDLEKTTNHILSKSSFSSITSHTLELFGVCKKCY